MLALLFASFLSCVSADGLFHAEGRAGLRLSSGDLSGQIGGTLEIWRLAGTFETWVCPFRWRTTVEESPLVESRYRELRFGITSGVRLRLQGDSLGWWAVSGGTELITGDWAGTVHQPETQTVPWVGLEYHIDPGAWIRLRAATESNRCGFVRLEAFIGFRKGGNRRDEKANARTSPPARNSSGLAEERSSLGSASDTVGTHQATETSP